MKLRANKSNALDQMSLPEVVCHWVSKCPDEVVFRFLEDGESESSVFSFRQLDSRARVIASIISSQAEVGDRILLCYSPGTEFIAAFLGCLYARVAAVPISPPEVARGMKRLIGVADDCKANLILTDRKGKERFNSFGADLSVLSSIALVCTEEVIESSPFDLRLPALSEIAFIQYTSGSTGRPKGVMVTHGNLSANLSQTMDALRVDFDPLMVNWLPVYHDMGLIGCILLPLFAGFPSVLMPPVAFIEKPIRWLNAISKYRGTFLAAPNFAYDYCVAKTINDEIPDLSSLKVMVNAAEPVRPETLQRFVKRFAVANLSDKAFVPTYGLAEGTLVVSGRANGTIPKVLPISSGDLEVGKVTPSLSGPKTKHVVSCGVPTIGQTIAIVDPETRRECEDHRVGEIWVSGKNVAIGYWKKSELTREVFQNELPSKPGMQFMRTGDLGFLHEGELYVTGRIKDMIIVNGKNLYPHDIEYSAEKAHRGIRKGGSVAVAMEGRRGEEVWYIAEIDKSLFKTDLNPLATELLQAVGRDYEISLSRICFVKPGTIPKTTSGKLQRKKTAQMVQQKQLEVVFEWPAAPVVVQEQNSEQKVGAKGETSQRLVATIEWLRDYAASRINPRLMDERRSFQPNIVLDFGNRGLLGMLIPPKYGGLGLSHSEAAVISQQLAAIDLSTALFVGVNNGLGVHPILHFGSHRAKEHWLPLLASGRQLAAFAITERVAGSNPQALQATARAEGTGWVLNGEKIWSGNASWAGVINIFVKEKNSDGTVGGICAFAVDTSLKGIEQGPEALTMGVRSMVQNSVILNGVRVSADDRLGELGQGIEVASSAMNYSRFGIAVMCVGAMKRCMQFMLTYADARTISTGKLSENAIALSRMAYVSEAILAIESFSGRVAAALDSSAPVPVEVFLTCKILAPELLGKTVDWTMQLLGGRGYMENNLVAQYYRDARLIRIFEGPTETLEMHLGALVVNKAEGLTNWFTGEAEQKAWSEFIDEDVQKIQGLSQPLSNPKHKVWMQSAVGKLAALKILKLSVVAVGLPQSTFNWIDTEYGLTLERLVADSKTISNLSAAKISSIVVGYESQIGNIKYPKYGEEREMDPLVTSSHEAKPVQDGWSSTLFTPPAAPAAVSSPQSTPLQSAADTLKPKPTKPAATPKPVEQKVAPIKPGKVAPSTGNAAIQEQLVKWFAKSAQLTVDKIDPEKPLLSYGLDSLMAYELVCQIEENYDVRVPSSLVWDYPTISAVAGFISKALEKKKGH